MAEIAPCRPMVYEASVIRCNAAQSLDMHVVGIRDFLVKWPVEDYLQPSGGQPATSPSVRHNLIHWLAPDSLSSDLLSPTSRLSAKGFRIWLRKVFAPSALGAYNQTQVQRCVMTLTLMHSLSVVAQLPLCAPRRSPL